MAKRQSYLDAAATRIVRDEELIAELLDALEEARVPLEEGPYYAGNVLEVAAGVREAIAKGKRRLRVKGE